MLFDLDFDDLNRLKCSRNLNIQRYFYLIKYIDTLDCFKQFNIASELADLIYYSKLSGGLFAKQAGISCCKSCNKVFPPVGFELFNAPLQQIPCYSLPICYTCLEKIKPYLKALLSAFKKEIEISNILLDEYSKVFRSVEMVCIKCKTKFFQHEAKLTTLSHYKPQISRCPKCFSHKIKPLPKYKLIKRQFYSLKPPKIYR